MPSIGGISNTLEGVSVLKCIKSLGGFSEWPYLVLKKMKAYENGKLWMGDSYFVGF